MQYLKEKQTINNRKEKKVCIGCNKNRLIKFFEKPTSRKCDDCKRKAKRVKKRTSKRYILGNKLKSLREETIQRDNHQCQKCGVKDTQKVLHLSHVYTQGAHPELRLDPDNVKMLCHKCHMYWWHREVIEAKEWFAAKFPERLKRLKDKIKENK